MRETVKSQTYTIDMSGPTGSMSISGGGDKDKWDSNHFGPNGDGCGIRSESDGVQQRWYELDGAGELCRDEDVDPGDG